jgi:hypothetical protein
MSGKPRLTPEQRQEIRDKYALGTISQKALAEQYQVSIMTVGNIVKKDQSVPSQSQTTGLVDAIEALERMFPGTLEKIRNNKIIIKTSIEIKD